MVFKEEKSSLVRLTCFNMKAGVVSEFVCLFLQISTPCRSEVVTGDSKISASTESLAVNKREERLLL